MFRTKDILTQRSRRRTEVAKKNGFFCLEKKINNEHIDHLEEQVLLFRTKDILTQRSLKRTKVEKKNGFFCLEKKINMNTKTT